MPSVGVNGSDLNGEIKIGLDSSWVFEARPSSVSPWLWFTWVALEIQVLLADYLVSVSSVSLLCKTGMKTFN